MTKYDTVLLIQPSYITTGDNPVYRFWFYKQVQMLLKASEQLYNTNLGTRTNALAIVAKMNRYYDALLTIADTYFWDEFYQMLEEAKRIVNGYLLEQMPTLPDVVKVSVGNSTNSLAISYEYYGDLDHSIDIVKRNGISNPNNINNTTLELLTI